MVPNTHRIFFARLQWQGSLALVEMELKPGQSITLHPQRLEAFPRASGFAAP